MEQYYNYFCCYIVFDYSNCRNGVDTDYTKPDSDVCFL